MRGLGSTSPDDFPFVTRWSCWTSYSVGKDAGAEELAAIVRDCQDWPGALGATRAVAFADPNAESVLESVARLMFREQGLPPPTTQVTLGDDRGILGRVDFLWWQHRTIGGFEVVRFTWQQVTRRERETAGRLRDAFARSRFRVAFDGADGLGARSR